MCVLEKKLWQRWSKITDQAGKVMEQTTVLSVASLPTVPPMSLPPLSSSKSTPPLTLAALLINVGWDWLWNRSSFQLCHTGEMERQTVAKVDLTTTRTHTCTHTCTFWTQHAIKGLVSAQRVCQPATRLKCVCCMFAQLSVFVWMHIHSCRLPYTCDQTFVRPFACLCASN